MRQIDEVPRLLEEGGDAEDLNGIEATRRIRAECPGARVVALSSHSDSRYVAAILEAGACGYVLKANAYDSLRRALDASCASWASTAWPI